LYIAAKPKFINMIVMTPLKKFTLEFPMKVSPRLLYTLISTSEGLARWFAEKVNVKEDVYDFEWEGSLQTAKLIESKEPEYVRFEWTDDFHEGFMLEMRITHEPVSGESALIVSDYSEENDMDFTQMWWTTQVGRLQRMFNN
jgi:uncharacterized protein YndB with AHSA1/START domain